jgi:predicted transcriptional regulator
MSTTNADRFLNAYRTLENHLRETQRADRHDSFSVLLNESSNRAVQRYRFDLRRFGDLRNAIVHEPHHDGQPIADPREAAVEEFERIVERVTNPPGLSPFMHDVYTATREDDIGHVIEKMETDDFSQMPIVDEEKGVTAVLTTNTIARWVGARLHEDGQGLLVTNTTVGDVLPHAEREDNYAFLARDASLYDAREAFQIEGALRQPPDAVLITHSGTPTESLLGIITPFDLPNLVSRL